MSVLTEVIEKLEASVVDIKAEIAEFDGGKKAAAGRVRKSAQSIKTLAQEIRVKTMDQLKSMPTNTRKKAE